MCVSPFPTAPPVGVFLMLIIIIIIIIIIARILAWYVVAMLLRTDMISLCLTAGMILLQSLHFLRNAVQPYQRERNLQLSAW